MSNLLTYNMIINRNVLASIMLSQINRHVVGTNIFITDLGRAEESHAKITWKSMNPYSFSNSFVLKFSRRSGDSILLFRALRDKIGFKKHRIVSGGMT